MNTEKIKKQTIAILIIILALVLGGGIWFGKTSGLAGYYFCKVTIQNIHC